MRPHEALADQPLPPVEYPAHFEQRLVSANGGIRWIRDWVNVSHVLARETIGLEEIDDGQWELYVGRSASGAFTSRSGGSRTPRDG